MSISSSPPKFGLAEAEKNASISQFLRRQLLSIPPPARNVNLKGKTAIVTGSNIGLGLEATRQLLDRGVSRLILAVRNESKGQAAIEDLSSGRNLDDDVIEVWKLDMLSYESITAFVERTQRLEKLDIVILNAAIMKEIFDIEPATKHEECFQVNYLSTALLAILLLPVLKAKAKSTSEPGKLVWVQSEMAAWAEFKEQNSIPLFPAFDKPDNFKYPDRYSTSKLVGHLFVNELTRRVPSSVAIITMPSPGWCYGTNLGFLPGFSISRFITYIIKRLMGNPADIGARTIVDGAFQGPEAHGQYLEQCKIQVGPPLMYKEEGDLISQVIWDETMAELSWANVERIVRELSK